MAKLYTRFNDHWTICYFIIIFISWDVRSEYMPNDWVDPNDMRNYIRYEKNMKMEDNWSEMKILEPSEQNSNCISDLKRYNIFIERFINHLIKVIKLGDAEENGSLSSEVIIKISAERLRALKNFGKEFSSSHLAELDEIFSSIFSKKTQYNFDFISYFNLWYYIHDLSEVLAGLSLITIVIFTLWMFGTGKSLYRIICFLYLTSFLMGLIWNWWIKYQEMVVNQYVEIEKYSDIPESCTSSKLSIMTYINSWFKEPGDCQQYYKTHNIHPLSRIKPSLVFSETFTLFFSHPLSEVGRVIQKLCYELSSVMPWPLNLLIYPIFLIITLVFVLCCVSLYFNNEIRIWSYFGSVIIGGKSHFSKRDNCYDHRDERTNVDRISANSSTSLPSNEEVSLSAPARNPQNLTVDVRDKDRNTVRKCVRVRTGIKPNRNLTAGVIRRKKHSDNKSVVD